MATTVSDDGRDASRYRAAQLGLTRLLVRDVRGLRRLIIPSRLQASVPDWIAAVQAIVDQYARTSAALGAEFYDAQRDAAGVAGVFTVPVADPPPGGQTEAGLRWATKDIWERDPDLATAAQLEPLDTRLEQAERKAEQVVQKLVADTGRATVIDAVRQDRQATAWARSAALGACAFCKLLSSRGAVFAQDTVRFQAHDNCVPAGTLVDGPAAEVGYRRWYEGEMLVIGTAAGHELSITPNHPVLTDRGWIPAGLLTPGDCVLSSLDAQGSSLDVPDEENVPARIEEVWRALSMLGLVGVPVAPEDFHGDGAYGEVDVVRADGLLGYDGDVMASQVLAEVELTLACVRESLFALLGSPEQFIDGDFATTSSVVSSLCKAEALLSAQLGQSVGLRLASASNWDSGLNESAPYGVPADLVAPRERELALSVQVRGGDVLNGQVGLVGSTRDASLVEFAREHGGRNSAGFCDLGAVLAREVELNRAVKVRDARPVRTGRFDPSGLYGSMDGADAYARLGRDLGERLAGRVERDRVVELQRREFSGHVYNLQTAQGWYRADGVIVSNCHCGAIPVFRGQRFELSPHATEWARLYQEYAAGHSGSQLARFRRALAEHDPNPLPGSF